VIATWQLHIAFFQQTDHGASPMPRVFSNHPSSGAANINQNGKPTLMLHNHL
jgi:hypothetical protein